MANVYRAPDPKGMIYYEPGAKPAGEPYADDRRRILRNKETEEKQKELDERLAEAMKDAIPFEIMYRPIEQGDYNFVLNAWMRSNRETMRKVRSIEYFAGQQALIAEIAKRRQICISCDADTPEWIAGFACGMPLVDGRIVVDFIYVKHAYRRRGIAQGMLRSLGWTHGMEIVATHLSNKYVEKSYLRYNACYNPFFNMIGYSDV